MQGEPTAWQPARVLGTRNRLREEAAPAPLVCVTHREPFARRADGTVERTTGGVVTALDAALRELGGVWVATGDQTGAVEIPIDASGRSYAVAQVPLSEAEIDGYYCEFANRMLWPLFHSFVGRASFSDAAWQAYAGVNARLADAVVRHAGDDGLVWVHDYQLALVPGFVRVARPDATIGFFLHIPFPAYEVFRILPTRRELLEGLLGADLVGFHCESYREAFVDAARRLLGLRVTRRGDLEFGGRRVRTVVLPIGLDVAEQARLAADPRTDLRARRLRETIGGERLLLGVDRLDYSKGILERLAAVERLFERHPEHRGRVTLLQIAVPSRTGVEEYRQLKRDVDEAVGRINGRFGDPGWTPIRYFNRSFGAAELAAIYRAADVALVTPLRDGLNLVAKEFVASRVNHGGALVLSEFCGAAEELPQAYLVNPYDADGVAQTVHEALTDPPEDRRARMAALEARVRGNDVHDWARRFVGELTREALH